MESDESPRIEVSQQFQMNVSLSRPSNDLVAQVTKVDRRPLSARWS